MEKARRQRRAVEEIERLGGIAVYEWEFVPPSVSGISPKPNLPWSQALVGDDNYDKIAFIFIDGQNFDDALADHVKWFTGLRCLLIEDARVTDAGLKELAELPYVHEIQIIGGEITDVGLRHLGEFSNLSDLMLFGTQFDDDGLKHLAGLTRLRRLGLGSMRITDAGMRHLEGLCNLQELSFDDVHISDAGLEHLVGLTKLELLIVTNTDVTPEGIRKLQEALPNCEIMY